MHLTVRSRIRGEKINRSIIESGEKLFQKFEDLLPQAAAISVDLEHLTNHKKGRTHYTHVTITIPGEPRTYHVEALTEDFRTGLDRTYARATRIVHKWHTRAVRHERRKSRANKEKVNNWLHATLSKPFRFFKKFRKHDPEIPEV